MKTAQILRLFWLGFAIHFGITLSCLLCLHLEPVKDVKLTTQSDAILIYGQNEIGSSSIRVFKNWGEMQGYLTAQKLELPKPSFAEKGSDIEATLEKSVNPRKSTYYRIFWKTPQAQHSSPLSTFVSSSLSFEPQETLKKSQSSIHKLVIHTPDPESALEMLKFVKYFGLSSSVMGYSVPLEVKKDSSI